MNYDTIQFNISQEEHNFRTEIEERERFNLTVGKTKTDNHEYYHFFRRWKASSAGVLMKKQAFWNGYCCKGKFESFYDCGWSCYFDGLDDKNGKCDTGTTFQ